MLRPENGKGVIDFQASIREAFHREALPYRGAADRIDEVADQIFDYAQNRPKFLGINIKTRAYNADIEACRINTYGLGIEGIESLGPALIALSLAKKLNLRDHQEHLLYFRRRPHLSDFKQYRPQADIRLPRGEEDVRQYQGL